MSPWDFEVSTASTKSRSWKIPKKNCSIFSSDGEEVHQLIRNDISVGNTGSHKCTEFETLEAALGAFKEAFSDKTGNNWEDRDHFVKKPNKFYPVGVDTHLEKEHQAPKYLEVSKSSSMEGYTRFTFQEALWIRE